MVTQNSGRQKCMKLINRVIKMLQITSKTFNHNDCLWKNQNLFITWWFKQGWKLLKYNIWTWQIDNLYLQSKDYKSKIWENATLVF